MTPCDSHWMTTHLTTPADKHSPIIPPGKRACYRNRLILPLTGCVTLQELLHLVSVKNRTFKQLS